MFYDMLDGAPCKVLGYSIKTRTQVVLSCIVPAFLELNIYVLLVFTDIAVAYRHFYEGNSDYGALTVVFLCLPALICFCSIVSSPGQWPSSDDSCSSENIQFLLRQIFNMVFFPLGAMYRFCRRLFWGVEALFHEKNTYERCHAVSKAAEYSPFELYHFIQAFFHAAPQLIFQLNLLLRGNIFRDFETATVQAMSVIFCFITMGNIITTYQRFESQKIVGRNYPWCSAQQVQQKIRQFRRSRSVPSEVIRKQSTMPQYPDVLSNFKSRLSETNNERESVTSNTSPRKTLNVNQFNFNERFDKNDQTDDEKMEKLVAYDEIDRPTSSKTVRMNIPLNRYVSSTSNNTPDEQLIQNYHEIKKYLVDDDIEFYEEDEHEFEPPAHTPIELRPKIHSDNFDEIPSVPPPPPPNTSQTGFFRFPSQFKRISTYKDMLVQNTKHYIHEHVPRLPEKYFGDEKEPDDKPDEVDLVLPSGRTIFNGIEQDDAIGKLVSFFGWMLFLVMRMLTLSVFSVFYPEACVIVLISHYSLMLVCLLWEIKLHEKIERIWFYTFLGIVYVFTILEFKIKFRSVRRWYCGYIAFVMAQNLVLTFIWYAVGSSDSWWFHFLFMIIIGSGILSLMCLMFYYVVLKPENKILLENTENNLN